MTRFADITPILDRDLETGDDVLAGLGYRIAAARSRHARRAAAFDWIN